jgi:phosphoribosyl-ATP pyrophosphohydrolase/phosphoribosyl-AMP cyclohydrolase
MKKQQLNFEKLNGLIPCIVQDARTKVVLMLGFMNEEAYQKTIDEKRLTFYSRSKERLWTKGETSGNFLKLIEITADCDTDTLLAKVIPQGRVCHTGADTCFNERNEEEILGILENTIRQRRGNPTSGSYTTSLFDAGISKIAQKVGEEAVELILEAKDNDMDRFLNEGADLLYHYLVLLAAKDCYLKDVLDVLKKRNR